MAGCGAASPLILSFRANRGGGKAVIETVKAQDKIVDKFQPCMEMGAVMAASMVDGTVVVNHGPSGCSISNTHFRSNNVPDGTNVPIFHTAVQQADLIYGGTPKMRDRVREVANRYKGRADAIWLLSACATSMVQDDLVGVARQVEGETGVPIIPLDTPGFQGGYRLGAQMVYRALIDRFADKSRKPQKGKINIIGHHMMGSRNMIDDTYEIVRLLEAADVQVNVHLTFNTRISDLERFCEAEANYVLTPEVLPDFEAVTAELGMENWGTDVVLPYGLANTEEWYLKIAERFGDVEKAKKQLKTDMNRVRRRIANDYNASWVMHDVAGKRVGVLGYSTFAAAMARYLFFDLNARPAVVGLWAETDRAMEVAKKQLEEIAPYVDMKVLDDPSYYQYGRMLVEENVDFAIGQKNDRTLVEGLKIPHLGLGGFYYFNHFTFIPWPYAGVLGTLHLLTEMARVTDEVKSEKGGWIARSYIKRDTPYDEIVQAGFRGCNPTL